MEKITGEWERELRMRITSIDKVQALRRSKKYKDDYKRYQSQMEKGGYKSFFNLAGEYISPLSPPAEELCRKYKIPCPVILPQPGEEQSVMPFAPIIVYLNDEFAVPEEDGYLTMRVDLARSLREIREAMERLYKIYRFDNPEKKRARESGLDIWEVYDLKQAGLKPNQIARKLSGRGGTPTHDGSLESWVKNVKSAIKKAEDIITAVEE